MQWTAWSRLLQGGAARNRMQILNYSVTSNLLDRLQRLRPETRALWGKMNAHQMVCHLNDAFGLAMGAKTASEDITFFDRMLIRWVALHTPLTWPRGVPTRPEMDQLAGGTWPTEFALDSDALAAAIQRFGRQPRAFQFSRHPTFGDLTEWEWMRWGYLHADHHFRQFGV
jgi:hypothetical protein